MKYNRQTDRQTWSRSVRALINCAASWTEEPQFSLLAVALALSQ